MGGRRWREWVGGRETGKEEEQGKEKEQNVMYQDASGTVAYANEGLSPQTQSSDQINDARALRRKDLERTFDVGIAEQHAVTFAAGMATEGLKPFCAIYSTFLQRAYDQAS